MKKIFIFTLIILSGCIMITKEYRSTKNYSYEYLINEEECKKGYTSSCTASIERNLNSLQKEIEDTEVKLKKCLSIYNKEVCQDLVIKKDDLISWKEKFLKLKMQISKGEEIK